jgi:phosphoenolpyruvate phosphomutase
MKDIAADIPMAMLDVNGKPLLQRQREILNLSGVRELIAVGGYRREKIVVDGIKLSENPQWVSTGELTSILAGDMDADYPGRTLISYSDILFDKDALNRLLSCDDDDIVLLVDSTDDSKTQEHSKAANRRIDLVLLADAGNPTTRRVLQGGARSQVLKIGKNIPRSEAHGEFTGLALFSAKGWKLFRRLYDAARGRAPGRFHEAATLETASLTDMVQELIDQGHPVSCVQVTSGWMEIHSFEDYKLACRLVSQ